MKKFLSILLSLTIAMSTLAVFTVTASAKTLTYGDYEYEILDNDTVEITRYNGSAGELTIPSEIDGKTVTSIGDQAFAGNESLISVIIPNGVTGIGWNAFGWCTNLTEITIPEGVTYIGYWTFADCVNLKKITIPSTVTGIDEYAFNGCRSMTFFCYKNTAGEEYAIAKGFDYVILEVAGDINGDAALDIMDVALSRAYIIGAKDLSTEQIAAADMNGDGTLDIIDVVMMRKAIVG